MNRVCMQTGIAQYVHATLNTAFSTHSHTIDCCWNGRSFLSCHWFISVLLIFYSLLAFLVKIINTIFYFTLPFLVWNTENIKSKEEKNTSTVFGVRPLSLGDCVIIRTSQFTHYAKFGKNNETIERISKRCVPFILFFFSTKRRETRSVLKSRVNFFYFPCITMIARPIFETISDETILIHTVFLSKRPKEKLKMCQFIDYFIRIKFKRIEKVWENVSFVMSSRRKHNKICFEHNKIWHNARNRMKMKKKERSTELVSKWTCQSHLTEWKRVAQHSTVGALCAQWTQPKQVSYRCSVVFLFAVVLLLSDVAELRSSWFVLLVVFFFVFKTFTLLKFYIHSGW